MPTQPQRRPIYLLQWTIVSSFTSHSPVISDARGGSGTSVFVYKHITSVVITAHLSSRAYTRALLLSTLYIIVP